MAGNQTLSPIFIHAMWRTGSTYLWKKFSDKPQYRAYYEPLHENNAHRPRPDGPADARQLLATARTLRHPIVERPYFSVYPYRVEGGVEYFESRFSYDRYCLAEQDVDPELQHYFAHLISCAALQEQVAVFKCNRALLRSAWLAAHFPGRTIVLLRRPFDIWKSFESSGPYYLGNVCYIIGRNRAHPLLAPLAEAHQIPCFHGKSVAEEQKYYVGLVRSNAANLYQLFWTFSVLTTLYSVPVADCVVDVNQITESQQARDRVRARLEALHCHVDLADCHVPSYDDSADTTHRMRSEQEGSAMLGEILANNRALFRASEYEKHATQMSPYLMDVCSRCL